MGNIVVKILSTSCVSMVNGRNKVIIQNKEKSTIVKNYSPEFLVIKYWNFTVIKLLNIGLNRVVGVISMINIYDFQFILNDE